MAKKLPATRWNIPFDAATEGGEQAVCRFITPAGMDRRKIRRILRKIFLQLGERNAERACREMGFNRYV
jgi:hypothetical protein